ncbi:hypothetical protein [Nocardiopsis sp. CC223A]|uniref:hypothetical protein n=1 Tax=Nocardiopsis sp. CC223A TaxID=3044051 RepID=UPI00278C218A|nr:hypothetical protein [Nocardiopsis sp. CC223A]
MGEVPPGKPAVSSSLTGSAASSRRSWTTSRSLTAARVWKIAERIKASGVIGLGDKGYMKLAKMVLCPFKGRCKPQWSDANSTHTKCFVPGERASAQLKQWDLLCRLRCCPQQARKTIRAVLVLQLGEAGRKRLLIMSDTAVQNSRSTHQQTNTKTSPRTPLSSDEYEKIASTPLIASREQ